ncbi:hypothetical protein [Acinetobacter wuhouensis]|uniref:hypothetical protein n=1 Tax=Acinetobacter wuhouensis TaxID=1879050 RepID=UPI001D194AEF|nr:hypothetical protein [Acinetobacter wuhouensis]
MKTYYYYYDKEEDITTFCELDEELYCLRATFQTANGIFSTNSPLTPAHLFLPESSFLDFIDELSPISQEQFKDKWNISNKKYLIHWENLKNKYQINQSIKTSISFFPPLGVIVQFGEIFYGLVNYNDCKAILGENQMYPHQQIQLYIEHFDDDNLWIKFSTKSN